MKQKLQFTVVLLIFVIFLGVVAVRERMQRTDIEFPKALDTVVVAVDDKELLLKDLAFYIAYQEGKIEEEARVYNPEDTGEYWRLHTNDVFLREAGKQKVIDMAVHDEIFYQLALAEGVELTEEEEEHLANDQYDFWSDLEEDQREGLGVSEDVIKESMRKLALAEKYQSLLSAMYDSEMESYSIGGQAYERMLEEHTVTVDESIWDRVHFGGITLDH